MADGVVHVLPEQVTLEMYEAVNQKLSERGADAPSGLKFNAAGRSEDGHIRIIEVWDSRSDFDRFNDEHLTPAISEVSGAPPDQAPSAEHIWFSVHSQYPE
jgi:quinol monooxygenase YgiN